MSPVCLAISVEGLTEQNFVQQVLGPHLVQRGMCAVKAFNLRGKTSMECIQRQLRGLVGDRKNYSFVTTLYDFYGFRKPRPDTPEELEQKIHGLLGNDRRLIPYVQMHEFEALLFSDPDKIAEACANNASAAVLRRAVDDCGGPEKINDSRETSPSHRIKAAFPAYDKTVHGPEIATAIGLDAIRAACPRFNAWLTRLEALAP